MGQPDPQYANRKNSENGEGRGEGTFSPGSFTYVPYMRMKVYSRWSNLLVHFQMSSPTTYFWYRETLNISPSVDERGSLNWWIVISLLVAWIIVFLCMVKGIASSGKVRNIPPLFTSNLSISFNVLSLSDKNQHIQTF